MELSELWTEYKYAQTKRLGPIRLDPANKLINSWLQSMHIINALKTIKRRRLRWYYPPQNVIVINAFGGRDILYRAPSIYSIINGCVVIV